MTPDSPRPVHYAFGNHMHWVDMEWLWGYHVLPGSIRDMLRFCQETGAKGGVNFDGVGYEKLAAEDPDALAELRLAIADGTIEPVGCSYGQPYGLFHGGESNVRQRIYGVRTAIRLLSYRPRTFWEEEFDFFPQLPQMLKNCGFKNASLFFQWTWHTPEIPREDLPAIWWEGVDGSRLKTATRNRLNLHQWPEDFDGLLDGLAAEDPPDESAPLILQWLELMPSPDWMCRTEVLLPRMKELLADPRFEVRFGTLGDYFAAQPDDLPVRQYAMDQVWHGMTLGKNGDAMRRQSFLAENGLLAAESLAAIAGLLGRPYAFWDVYPTWELEEAWRKLLVAQHHDNEECEGLCGHVPEADPMNAWNAAIGIRDKLVRRVTESYSGEGDSTWIFNPLGWERAWNVVHQKEEMTVARIPAMGWAKVPAEAESVDCGRWVVEGRTARFRRGAVEVDIDLDSVTVTRLANSSVPDGLPLGGKPLWKWLGLDASKRPLRVQGLQKWFDSERPAPTLTGSRMLRLPVAFAGHEDDGFTIAFLCEPHHEGLEVRLEGLVPRPQAGMNSAFGWRLSPAVADSKVVTDEPFSISEKRPTGTFQKKYPTGDWMTSTQWFEEVRSPFTASNFVDLNDLLLVVHDGCRQWFREEDGAVRHILHAYDPWDEDNDSRHLDNRFLFLPHDSMTPTELWKTGQEAMRECTEETALGPGSVPNELSSLRLTCANAAVTAFYREAEDYAGMGLENYAGRGMGYPFVLRLVEFDGEPAEVDLILAGPIASAFKTNLMGEIAASLTPENLTSEERENRPLRASHEELAPFGIVPQRLRFAMRPHEIATLYLDLVPGRKQTRDLDAKREIWATVHRTNLP